MLTPLKLTRKTIKLQNCTSDACISAVRVFYRGNAGVHTLRWITSMEKKPSKRSTKGRLSNAQIAMQDSQLVDLESSTDARSIASLSKFNKRGCRKGSIKPRRNYISRSEKRKARA